MPICPLIKCYSVRNNFSLISYPSGYLIWFVEILDINQKISNPTRNGGLTQRIKKEFFLLAKSHWSLLGPNLDFPFIIHVWLELFVRSNKRSTEYLRIYVLNIDIDCYDLKFYILNFQTFITFSNKVFNAVLLDL